MQKNNKELQKGIQVNLELMSLSSKYAYEKTVNLVTKK